MPNETDIRQSVFTALSDVAPEIESENDIDVNASLRDQVDLDSMDFLNLITDLCQRFETEISEKDYAKLVSFNDFVEYFSTRKPST